MAMPMAITMMKTNPTRNCIESPTRNAEKSPNSWATTWCTMLARSFRRWFLPSLVFDRAKPICLHTFYHFKWYCHSIRLTSRAGVSNGSFNWMLDSRMRCAWSSQPIISFFIATISLQFAFIFNFWSIQFDTMSRKFRRNTNENRATEQQHGRRFATNWPIPLPFTLNQLSIGFDQIFLCLFPVSLCNFPLSCHFWKNIRFGGRYQQRHHIFTFASQ